MRNIFSIKNIRLCSILMLCAFSGVSYADSVVGQIDTLYASLGTNFGYRVFLTGGIPACSAPAHQFAYTNISDDNYKAYISTLMLAYALSKPVTIVTDASNGYCHILEVYVHQ